MNLSFTAPITELPGVGSALQQKLEWLGIATIKDLLYHIPFRYDDFSAQKTITEIEEGEQVTIRATIHSITKFATRRGMTIVKAVLTDDSGKIDAIWFNQPYLLMSLRKGSEKLFSGKVGVFNKKKTLTAPTTEEIKQDGQIHSGRLVPIYPETDGLTSRTLRNLIDTAFKSTTIDETLPEDLRVKYRLPALDASLRMLHFPDADGQVEKFRRRLAFEEVYGLLREAKERHGALQKIRVPQILHVTTHQREAFEHALPFTLSPSQVKTLFDLSLDLLQPYPAHRLIQGEVGSGKTVVAAFALYCASLNDVKSVFVAPTQILAHQHAETLKVVFAQLKIPLTLVTGNEREEILPPVDSRGMVYIGTHALLGKTMKIRPAVVVVDEEHRFGVAQRETFWKGKRKPHLITMTATPIPRTVAQTVLADREVSYLEEIPGREKQIATRVVSESKREEAFHWIGNQVVEKHAQVFVICPFIDQSSKETVAMVRAVEQEYAQMVKRFPQLHIGMLHGKVVKEDRGGVIEKMRAGAIDILVATSMVEVGIDIPKATIMMIEGAERFGLAQLHQLRGRVGRVGQKAYCLLFPSIGIENTSRLKAMENSLNGNELAEQDLRIRGTGDILGTDQHGWGALKFASWFDTKLIGECREAVTGEK